MKQQIETLFGCSTPYEQAKLVLYGAPFDSTTSFRPGARFGASAMRHDSFGLETYSPYQDKDLSDCLVFDCGDLELGFGAAEPALASVEQQTQQILEDGKFPILLGGEHTLTLGAVWAALKQYPDLEILQFDAHADLRQTYLGVSMSHACVMRRCFELVGDGKLHQFCIRSGDQSEFQFAAGHTDLHFFGFNGLEQLAASLAAHQTPVYLTIDLDCLDCSVLPGTGTPEAGGVSFSQLLDAILCVSQANIVAADLMELAPMLDPSGASTATACKVLRELLLSLSKEVTL